MKNLTKKELLNINGGEVSNAFMNGREFAENAAEVIGEVVHNAGDFLRGLWYGL